MKLVLAIIAAAVLTRFMPHLPNLAPITAIAIFSGAYLPKKYAVALPLTIRFISDIFLGFFSWPLMVAVYASHAAGVLFGLWIKKSQRWQGRWMKIGMSSVSTALLFFLVTNFAFLYPNYSHDFSGLVQSYINGLPFLRGTLMGDIGYSVALFGAYQLATSFKFSKATKLSESAS